MCLGWQSSGLLRTESYIRSKLAKGLDPLDRQRMDSCKMMQDSLETNWRSSLCRQLEYIDPGTGWDKHFATSS
jgi:hypothetical protein